MTKFTIETTYHLPVYRQHTYDAATIGEACRLAIEDDDWSDEKYDTDSARATYVSGIWRGVKGAYRGRAVKIPSEFREVNERKAEHFEVLLGVLKIVTYVKDLQAPGLPYWFSRVQSAVARAEAIMAGAPDPESEPGIFVNRTHTLLMLEELRVRDQIASILETDPATTPLTTDAISDADIHTACLLVTAESDLSEERGAAEFHAALAAIREAEHRLAASG